MLRNMAVVSMFFYTWPFMISPSTRSPARPIIARLSPNLCLSHLLVNLYRSSQASMCAHTQGWNTRAVQPIVFSNPGSLMSTSPQSREFFGMIGRIKLICHTIPMAWVNCWPERRDISSTSVDQGLPYGVDSQARKGQSASP